MHIKYVHYDNMYVRSYSYNSLVQLISKVTHFDPAVLHKLCWECYCGSPDDCQYAKTLTLLSQQSALLLWLLFCKLDTDGKLKLLSEV